MCTTAAKRLSDSWFLLKTRDPVRYMRWDDEIKLFNEKQDKYKKLIIQNPIPHEDGYYGGINEKGVAFIATFVKVAEDQISYLRKPYIRLILDASSAKEAVAIIEEFNPRIGGNIFVADVNECYGIEAVPEKYFVEKVEEKMVKVNHFINLPNSNIEFATDKEFEKWDYTHLGRAEELITKAENLDDCKQLLRDRENADTKRAICTVEEEDACYTYSAMIFDTKNCKAHYCQGNLLENEFVEYGF